MLVPMTMTASATRTFATREGFFVRVLVSASPRCTSAAVGARPPQHQQLRCLSSSGVLKSLSSSSDPHVHSVWPNRNDHNIWTNHRRMATNAKPLIALRSKSAEGRQFLFSTSTVPGCRHFSTQLAKESDKSDTSITNTTAFFPQKPIRILYASQGGTAQIFAQQLSEALEEYYYETNPDSDEPPPVTVEGWHEYPKKDPSRLLTPGDAWHVFLVSVTGVGEPPDNGRAFYEYLTTTQTDADASSPLLTDLEYTVFGLGNSKAHPNHYNVIGIHLDERLQELGGRRIHPLGLGDDGDCLEDDFDVWMENFLSMIRTGTNEGASGVLVDEGATAGGDDSPAEATNIVDTKPLIEEEDKTILTTPCLAGVTVKPPLPSSDLDVENRRRISAKFPTLHLDPPKTDVVAHDLFHLQDNTDNAFYAPTTVRAKVTKSRSLSAYGGEAGLREIRVNCSSSSGDDAVYTTGDHCLVYPRNAGCVVEAYMAQLDVHPHAIIQGLAEGPTKKEGSSYPFPTGLSVYETLSHCIDLGAIPSPSFSRFLLGRRELEYKQEIAVPRRTILDLMKSSGRAMSLEDLLFQATPMKPRHYSIASSSLASPQEICMTFRPIKYMTSQGHMREGVCTNYMASMVAMDDDNKVDDGDDNHTQYMPIHIASNPTFRLPQDPKISVLLIAGGCGVAPIRAFVQERLHLAKENQATSTKDNPYFGQGLVYLGFRSPDDEVHRPLIDKALEFGGLTEAKVAYSYGCTEESQYCMNVNKLVRKESQKVWDHLESGGYTYLCGGARTFGAAIEQELLELIQEHGQMGFEGAEAYLRNLIETGRLLEDLAD